MQEYHAVIAEPTDEELAALLPELRTAIANASARLAKLESADAKLVTLEEWRELAAKEALYGKEARSKKRIAVEVLGTISDAMSRKPREMAEELGLEGLV